MFAGDAIEHVTNFLQEFIKRCTIHRQIATKWIGYRLRIFPA